MHKRFPGVTSSKKVWAACPWAQYVIKVSGVYIAFDNADSAAEYTDDGGLTPHTRNYKPKRMETNG